MDPVEPRPPDREQFREVLAARREHHLNPRATRDVDAVRERPVHRVDFRSPFFRDSDKILHSWAYTRYVGKTQVFFTASFDMMSNRLIHVQMVSKIARFVGRALGFNQDLIEAIALGHDIGHPPFGHQGEQALSAVSHEAGLGYFWHNYQGVRFLYQIERHNLTLQTLDGILCHNGESREFAVRQAPPKTFATLRAEMARVERASTKQELEQVRPMTPEGCIVRLCDVIGYVGRDLEDAIVMGVVDRADVPGEVRATLGTTNRDIINTLVYDLIFTFWEDYPGIVAAGGARDAMGTAGATDNPDAAGSSAPETSPPLEFHFSPAVKEALQALMAFNYERIYMAADVKHRDVEVATKMRTLFARFVDDVEADRRTSPVFRDHLDFTRTYLRSRDVPGEYPDPGDSPGLVVRDFLAGMTEAYFDECVREYL